MIRIYISEYILVSIQHFSNWLEEILLVILGKKIHESNRLLSIAYHPFSCRTFDSSWRLIPPSS